MTHRYTSTAIFLHWLVALGLAGTFALGYYMEALPFSPNKLKLIAWHKWAGITLLALVVVRVVWRLTHRAPSLPSDMGPASRLAAHAGHALLYVLMLAIPLTGWLASSAQGVSVVLFGVWPLPDLLGKSRELGTALQNTHRILNYLLLAVVIGHVGAALQHHFVKKDTVLARMLPFLSKQ
ncbi:cytochrome b [Achromobacter sp. F4_2707]|uniref:cytochrome b n=1 Tax=Achromobacter sp. F4_2707 TaxID=3114286 RepID=UPI0039C67B48